MVINKKNLKKKYICQPQAAPASIYIIPSFQLTTHNVMPQKILKSNW